MRRASRLAARLAPMDAPHVSHLSAPACSPCPALPCPAPMQFSWLFFLPLALFCPPRAYALHRGLNTVYQARQRRRQWLALCCSCGWPRCTAAPAWCVPCRALPPSPLLQAVLRPASAGTHVAAPAPAAACTPTPTLPSFLCPPPHPHPLLQFFTHTELVGRLWWPLELVLNTPSHHRVHHARNYGRRHAAPPTALRPSP